MIPVVQADVEARLRRDLETEEVNFLPGIVDEASVLIEGYLGVCYAEGADVPDAVTLVTSRVAARILTTSATPSQTDSLTRGMGPFSATQQFVADSTSGGPWLTKTDRIALAPYRERGAISVPLIREGS